jgi:outer membrane receptor protein involved in Fe transport
VLLLPVAARSAPGDAEPEMIVVTATALPGTAIDPDKIAVGIQTLSSDQLNRFGAANALSALQGEVAGVSIADAQGNAFQPSLFYRGFEASPLAGDAQGLAVYANGARLNQPFGDTLNWELIPDVAIDRLTLEGSSPVFGLNALGGSLVLQMKNGFTFSGAQVEGLAGSFGRFQASGEYGVEAGNRAFYIAANALTDDGWRQHSPSRLGQIFADAGLRSDGGEFHLSLLGAQGNLAGNGTLPVELLAVDRSAVFTYPDKTKNTYGLANFYGTQSITDALSIQGNLYLSHLKQRTFNADASEAAPCTSSPGLLCLDNGDGDVLTGLNGAPIPDFLSGGTYGQLNTTATDTTGYGGSLQAAYDGAVFGIGNHLVAGIAYDGGHAEFSAQSAIGALGADRGFIGPGIEISQADLSIAPVKVASDNSYYGFFASLVLDLNDALSLNASARYNIARIALVDKLGTALNGSHRYDHLNPAVGATYKFADAVSAYAGYSEANRAPTPAEFSCADPAAPCSLTNFFVGDPPLKQVVAHSYEAGLRGRALGFQGGTLTWHAGFYRTEARDDIMLVSSSIIGRGFFENVGNTRRQGVESSLDFQSETWFASLNYTYTDATFRSQFTLNSPENPFADVNGAIHVVSGDRLPSIPEHLVKVVVGYAPTPRWSIALGARAATGVYLRGDEANLNPKTGAYVAFDLSSRYRVTDSLEVFATVNNLFNAKYETFGTFSPTSRVPIAEAPGASNPRSLAPAPPFSIFAGVRVHL